MVAVRFAAAAILVLSVGPLARAQAFSVLPVNVFLAPGQRAATLSVTNQDKKQTAIQIRAYAWNQKDGEDQLTATDDVVISPPIATIAPGATQIVRLILRQAAQHREATYRILVDQIPPPAEPGIVHVVLRLSIPIFVQPETPAAPHVQFHVERDAGQLVLVGVNDGLRHETFRKIVLRTTDGLELKEQSGSSPYILAGSTRRWRMAGQGSSALPDQPLRLTAQADAGAIDQQVTVVTAP
jgi:fimbrial chaperone protein